MIKQNVSGTVYGVILNDNVSLQKIGALDAAPYVLAWSITSAEWSINA